MSEHSQSTIDVSSEPVAQPAAGSVLDRQGVTQQDMREESRSEIALESSITLTPATPPPPAPSVQPPPDQPNRPNFSRMEVHASSSNIHDDDEVRAQVTRWLLHELAPLLGLDPDRIQIRVNSDAESRTNARGARGVMEGRTIYLHPRLYQPQTDEGRHLLAHEATHVAQLDAPSTALVPVARATESAEREADEVATAFVQSLPVRVPRRRVPAGRIMAKETGEAPPAGPSHEALVAQNRVAEITEIKDRLSYGVFDWKITDEDITAVLRQLESLEFLSVTAVAELLTPKDRERFADNVDAVHFAAFRSTIIAFYLAIANKGEIKVLPEDPFPGMVWTGFSQLEHYAMREILIAFFATERGRIWRLELQQKEWQQTEDIIATKPANFDIAEERKKARKKEEKVATERKQAEEALGKGDVQDFLTIAKKKLSYGAIDWAVTDREVLEVIDGISDFAGDPAKVRAIVTELEREGLIDRLIDNLPVESLFTDVGEKTGGGQVNRRRVFLQILALRPPAKNAALAEELLSYGAFDWAITDEEAYLAQQVLKSLSPRARESFMALHERKYAKRLDAELSLSMKKGQTTNFYQGGEEGRDLQKIKSQLADDALWSLDQMNRLRMLIQMAIAAGEGDFVFAQSKDRYELYPAFRELYTDKAFFKRIIEDFKLYKPAGLKRPDGTIDAGREQYLGEPPVEGKPFFTDNGFWTYIIQGFDFIGESANVEVIGEWIGGEGLDFGEFQDITGGSFLGAEFKREEEVGEKERAELADNSVRWDLDHGILQMRAQRLEIANINYPLPNLKVQSSTGTVTGMHLHLQYPTEESPHKLTTLQLRIDSLKLDDFFLIFADSMVGFQSILVEGLTIELRPENVQEAFSTPQSGIAVGIPVLGPLISPIVNIIKLSGSIDELVKGLLEPESIMDATVTTQNVVLRGLTTSSGQYIEDIELGPLNLRTRHARGLDFYIRGLKEEKKRLETRLGAVQKAAAEKGPKPRYYLDLDTEPSLKLQLESIDRELVYIDEAQAERTRLTELKDKGEISPADQHKLWKVSKYLDGLAKGGVALDIASVKVEGLAGKVSAKEIGVGEIHGYGQSAGATLGFLFSSTAMNRMLRGRDYRGTIQGIEEEGDPQFFLETSNVTIKELAVEASVPTLEEAEKALEKAEDLLAKYPNDASLVAKRDRALVLRDAAETYWTILAKPGSMIVGAERDKLTKAREELTKERAFFAKLLTLDDVALELGQGPEGGERIGVTAGALHGERLEAGGVTVGAIEGKNVMIGAESRGGLSALMKDWRKELKTGQFAADSLVATDIVHAGSGAQIDKVALTRAGASLEVDGRGKIHVEATKVEVMGVSIVASRRLLEAEKEFLLMVPVEARHEADDKKIAAIDASIQELDDLEAIEKECQTDYDEARKTGDPKKIAEAEEMLKFATFAKTEWQRRLVLRGLSIDQLNISVLGLGNVLDEDFDPKAAFEKGFEAVGGGKGGRWLDAARIQDSKIPGLAGDEVVLGPTGGKLKHSAEQTVLEDFFIDSIDATGLQFHAPPHHLSSLGTSHLTKMRGSATFTRVKRPDKKGFDTWQLASIKVPTFHIDKIEGDRLNYAFSTDKDFFDLEIMSGSINNVWVDNFQIDFKDGDQIEMHGIDPAKGEPSKSGGAGIGSVDNLKLVGFLGSKIQAGGVLNGTGIKAEFITAKKHRYTIDEISASEGKFSQPGMDIGFSVRKLSLAVTRDITDTGDVFTVEKISVPVVTITSGSTITKGAMKIELLGTVTFTGTNLTGKVTRTKEGDKFKVISAVITDLIIPDITATSIHVTIEGQPADPAKGTEEKPPIDIVVPNANIKNLHVTGFDLITMKGSFETTSVAVKDVAVEIAKKGEAAFKKIGLNVSATGLGGTLMGPDRVFIDLGNMEISGSYEGGGVNVKKFALSGIGGFVDIGPDFVRVFDLNTGALSVGPVSYEDAEGNRLDMESIECPALHLKDLHAKWTKDAVTKEDKFSELTFTGLVFDKITARGFKYKGRFRSTNDKKQIVDSDLDLSATSATLEPFSIENFTYDALKELINVEPKIGRLNISQFQADFKHYVDAKLIHGLHAVTDVTGETMRANLNFGKVTSATGDSWKFSDGTFHMDQFGLKHPDIEYDGRDEKGELKTWTAKSRPGFTGEINLTGFDFTQLPDGAMFLDFDQLAASNLQVKQNKGPTIDIRFAALKNAEVAMQGQTPDKAFEILGATVKEVELQGIKVTLEIDRNVKSTASKPTDLWSLDALDSFDADLKLYFTDAGFYIDADVNCPIRSGWVDFNDVDIEHHLPDSKMGISPQGIYVDRVGTIMARKYLYERRNIKDARFETIINYEPEPPYDQGGYDIPDRGALNLRGFLEQMLNDPKAPDEEPPKKLEDLNRMHLSGSASIGDESLGTGKNRVTLSGKSAGKNVITISSVHLGENLRIEMPAFQASKGKFEAGGKEGETGEITANIKIDVTGLGSDKNDKGHFVFTVTLEVESGTVKGIKWGKVAAVSETSKKVEDYNEAVKKAKEEKAKEAEAAAVAK